MNGKGDRVSPRRLQLTALPGIPLVQPGDDLARLIADALDRAGEPLAAGDVVVVAQKIVSKAEGRYADLAEVTPTQRAVVLAAETEKDPRLVQLILDEANEVLRYRRGVLVVVHRLGYVMANAGIDSSNVGPDADGERVLLLPEDPDASCRRLRAALQQRYGVEVAVVVNDSVGRAWRNGTVGTALGAAGLPAVLDLRGRHDLFDRVLTATDVGLADEISAAASLLQGQADEGTPVVLVRGLEITGPSAKAAALLRPPAEDMFR